MAERSGGAQAESPPHKPVARRPFPWGVITIFCPIRTAPVMHGRKQALRCPDSLIAVCRQSRADMGLRAQAGRYGGVKLDQQVMTRRINWLNSIRTWQSEFVNSLSAREFVDCITDDLLGRGVFVFTPSGEVMRLPKVRLVSLMVSSRFCMSM